MEDCLNCQISRQSSVIMLVYQDAQTDIGPTCIQGVDRLPYSGYPSLTMSTQKIIPRSSPSTKLTHTNIPHRRRPSSRIRSLSSLRSLRSDLTPSYSYIQSPPCCVYSSPTRPSNLETALSGYAGYSSTDRAYIGSLANIYACTLLYCITGNPKLK